MAFYKDSNACTQKFKPGTSMFITIMTFKDHMFEFTFKSPSVTWYLKQAMDVASSSSQPGHVTALTATLKQVYEISKVKRSDPHCQHMPLESICN